MAHRNSGFTKLKDGGSFHRFFYVYQTGHTVSSWDFCWKSRNQIIEIQGFQMMTPA